MEDYFESFSEDLKKWDLIKNMIDLDLDDARRKDNKKITSIQLFPRKNIMLYGTIPKMEQRIYTKCIECKLVFNPRDILSHRACPGKYHSPSSPSLNKKVKTKGSISKKSHSNLKIQLRKLVPGRSKDIQQIIDEKKTVIKKEPRHGSNCSYTSPNAPNGQAQAEETKDSFSQNTTCAPVVGALSSASEPLETTNVNLPPVLSKISEPKPTISHRQTTSVVAAKQPILTDTENGNAKIMNNNYIKNKKKSDIGTVPVVYMPMSVISFVQIDKKVICVKSEQSQIQNPPVTNQSLYLPIPIQHSSIKMYKSHPKPVAVPNYRAKKIGGAILLSNQHLEPLEDAGVKEMRGTFLLTNKHIECQRNDILMAIKTKHESLNNIKI